MTPTSNLDVLNTFKNKLDWEWRQHPTCDAHHEKPRICHCVQPFIKTAAVERWMRRTSGQPPKSNLQHLLDKLKPKGGPLNNGASAILDGKSCCFRTFSILLKQGQGHLIYIFRQAKYTDEILQYSEERRPELKEARKTLKKKLKKEGVRDIDRIISTFESERWEFFPAVFDLNLDEEFELIRRLPICKRQRISPEKGGQTMGVFEIVVQEEFIGEELQQLLGRAFNVEKYGKCYILAVKSYSTKREEDYESELKAYNELSGHPGMVQSFGWYQHFDGLSEKTLNLLLEYGQMDLAEYFDVYYPPEQPQDIIARWKSICKIAKAIQKVHEPVDGDEHYAGYHGDIKPENILLVGDEFKLADFGFSQFHQKAMTGLSPQTTSPRQGTATYGAPKDLLEGQGRDIWSFGTVLSLMASWIVLGSKGTKIYHKLRTLAGEGRTPADAFHDGKTALPVVHEWHEFLKRHQRGPDVITEAILDVVEKRMLITDPEHQFNDQQLCDCLDKIIAEAELKGAQMIEEVHPLLDKALAFAKEQDWDEEDHKIQPRLHQPSSRRSARHSSSKDPSVRLSTYSDTSDKEPPAERTSDPAYLTVPSRQGDARRHTPPPAPPEMKPTNSCGTQTYEVIPFPALEKERSAATVMISNYSSGSISNRSDSFPPSLNLWSVIEGPYDAADMLCQVILMRDPTLACEVDHGRDRYTPIMLAAREHKMSLVDQLLPYSPLEKRDVGDNTVLHLAILGLERYESDDFIDVFKALVKQAQKDDLINSPNKMHKTALYLCAASSSSRVRSAAVLLEAGARVNHSRHPRRLDCLRPAVENNHEKLVEMFISNHARVDESHIGRPGTTKPIRKMLQDALSKPTTPRR